MDRNAWFKLCNIADSMQWKSIFMGHSSAYQLAFDIN